MRVLSVVLVVVALVVALAHASPHDTRPDDTHTSGSRTWAGIKQFFSPVTDYIRGLPSKTPDDVATDIKETATDVKVWVQENEAIQGLAASLTPVKDWIKGQANTLKDKTFRDMYDDLKGKVNDLDEKIGTWIQERNTRELPEIH